VQQPGPPFVTLTPGPGFSRYATDLIVPVPPVPVSVTSRTPGSLNRAVTWTSSPDLPINGVDSSGKLVGCIPDEGAWAVSLATQTEARDQLAQMANDWEAEHVDTVRRYT
jgi:hypothetical protein